MVPSTRGQRGLDWLNFFVANAQTGFGAFISVFLTSRHWTQAEIGIALSVGTVTAMASQVPAGALVDALRHKRLAAELAIFALIGSALLFALWPARLPVYSAEVLHGFASCMLTPAIAALSLKATEGRPGALGERLGRNARFGSIGSGLAAAAMGALGYWVSEQSVFFLTAVLCVPALLSLTLIGADKPLLHQRVLPRSPRRRRSTYLPPNPKKSPLSVVLADRRLMIFCGCVLLFHLANAAMLPLAASMATSRAGDEAALIIAACIVLPQLMVAALSPQVGRMAEAIGRKPVLLFGFAALPARAFLLASTGNPVALVAIQVLDGVSAAVFGVVTPLLIADLTERTGRFNLGMGLMGLAAGAGATISTSFAGIVAARSGVEVAFLALGGCAVVAMTAVWLLLPETRIVSPLVAARV